MSQLRTAEIAGLVYVNLTSTIPMRFVDREGKVIGALDALTLRESDALKPLISFEPVDDLYVAMSGMDWEEGVIYSRLVKRMSSNLTRQIAGCQRTLKIGKIVVDNNVMEAVRGAGLSMSKLFLPRIHNAYQHTFYAHNVAQLVESDIKNDEMLKYPSSFDRIKKI